jgi:pyruvate formate lyase activating enzyme
MLSWLGAVTANLFMTESGLIFNLQKYSLQDGPGIRTTVFLKGCPLCCAWCHNPESQSARREIVILETRCTACGECRRACPFGSAMPGEGPQSTQLDECTLCGECADACPTGARQIIGERKTVSEIMDVVLQDRIFYDDSGGGVTFSGGEPLTQPAFLKALLEACRAEGLRTAVDTCGFACTDVLLDIARLADLVLYDLKLMDDAKHRYYTGVSNVPILENLKALAAAHSNIWLRVPVIPGVNDSEANWRDTAFLAMGLGNIRQVNLLPYHKIGLSKFRRLGKGYSLEDVEPPSAERMASAAKIFRDQGLTAKIGG